LLNGVKNKKLFEAFSAEFFLFSQGGIHFTLSFTYRLDFFGSFFHQGKNEQVEIWITISVSDFVSIVAKKKQQYRQNRIVQIVLTKASQPWLQNCHPYGVLGFVNYTSLYGNSYTGNYFSF